MDNKKPRAKMPREERAKQFMPFAALKGFEQALREKERELSEEHQEKTDRKRRLSREHK